MRRICLRVAVALAAFCPFSCTDEGSSGSGPTDPAANDPVADNNGLIIHSPNGGETYHVGDTIMVRFGHVDSLIGDFDVTMDLVVEGNNRVPDISMTGTEAVILSDGEVAWAIPEQVVDVDGAVVAFPVGANTFRIRLRRYSGGMGDDDRTDGTFSILAP